jgi:hypothetical protein
MPRQAESMIREVMASTAHRTAPPALRLRPPAGEASGCRQVFNELRGERRRTAESRGEVFMLTHHDLTERVIGLAAIPVAYCAFVCRAAKPPNNSAFSAALRGPPPFSA